MATEAELLGKILERLDRMETKVDAMYGTWQHFAERAPVVGDAAGTSAQYGWDLALKNGIDPVATLEKLVPLALEAAKPRTINALARVVSRIDRLELALDKADLLEQKLAEAGVDQNALADKTIDLLARAASLSRSPEVDAFIQGGAFDPRAVDVVGKATRALVEVRREGAAPVGPFGALTALLDGDVQRAVGFSLAVARRLGQLLAR